MERDPRAFLWDVQQAAEAIREFIGGQEKAAYLENKLVRAAVEREFEIIGEALNQLSKLAPDLARRVPDIPEIVSFRNVLIHGYRRIDHELVWGIAATKLPTLHETVTGLLTELGPPGV